MSSAKENLAIILAGGTGTRLKDEVPKQFLKIGGRFIIDHAIKRFDEHPSIADIFIVIHPEYYGKMEEIVRTESYKKVKSILIGGKTRQESSEIGVRSAGKDYKNVLIHDAARPFVSRKIIDDILLNLEIHDAVGIAMPLSDTVIRIDGKKRIQEIPDRSELMSIQTPQGFRLKLISKAHELARDKGISDSLDDCSLVLSFNLSPIYIIEGSYLNLKITFPYDIHIAEKILEFLAKF